MPGLECINHILINSMDVDRMLAEDRAKFLGHTLDCRLKLQGQRTQTLFFIIPIFP
jgi:hypothetical protein